MLSEVKLFSPERKESIYSGPRAFLVDFSPLRVYKHVEHFPDMSGFHFSFELKRDVNLVWGLQCVRRPRCKVSTDSLIKDGRKRVAVETSYLFFCFFPS